MITIFERIVLYMVVLIAIYIFVKISEIEFNGVKILKLKYRILLALFFPLVIVIGFLLSSFLISLILVIGVIVFLYLKFFRKKGFKFIIGRK